MLGIRTDLLPYWSVRADMHLLALLRVDHGPYSIVAVRFVEAVLRGYDEHLLIIRQQHSALIMQHRILMLQELLTKLLPPTRRRPRATTTLSLPL